MLNEEKDLRDDALEDEDTEYTASSGWDPYAVPEEDTTIEQSIGSNLSEGLSYYKRYRKSVLIIVLIIFVGVMIYGNATGSGTVSVQINDEAVGVAGPNGTTTILMYEDVIGMEYYEDFSVGEALDAYDSEQNYEGTYTNDLLGEYAIIAYQKCTSMIVIETEDGFFAFNYGSESKTQKNYETLLESFAAYQ